MHTYKSIRDGALWTVGHYKMQGYEESSSEQYWIAMKDFRTEREAAAYVNYLNGGSGDLR
jgi:hypothetical protein